MCGRDVLLVLVEELCSVHKMMVQCQLCCAVLLPSLITEVIVAVDPGSMSGHDHMWGVHPV